MVYLRFESHRAPLHFSCGPTLVAVAGFCTPVTLSKDNFFFAETSPFQCDISDGAEGAVLLVKRF
jgi:hypothetical protein